MALGVHVTDGVGALGTGPVTVPSNPGNFSVGKYDVTSALPPPGAAGLTHSTSSPLAGEPARGPVPGIPNSEVAGGGCKKLEYAINRYMYETQRHYGIIEARLAKQKYMLGDTYTIVDMAVWGWARLMPTVLGDTAWAKYPNLKRMVDEISSHPAATRAIAIKDKHKFKTEFDDEARKAMFRHQIEKVA